MPKIDVLEKLAAWRSVFSDEPAGNLRALHARIGHDHVLVVADFKSEVNGDPIVGGRCHNAVRSVGPCRRTFADFAIDVLSTELLDDRIVGAVSPRKKMDHPAALSSGFAAPDPPLVFLSSFNYSSRPGF